MLLPFIDNKLSECVCRRSILFAAIVGVTELFDSLSCCTSAVYFLTDHTLLVVCNCEQFR